MKRSPDQIDVEFLRRLFAAAFLAILCTISFDLQSTPVEPQIINGTEVPNGQYPWMVALQYNNAQSGSQSQFCGGTIVAPRWVLTSARCVVGRKPIDILVAVGSVDLASSDVDRISVTKIVGHPNFVNKGYKNVALLRLERSVDPAIVPLRLAAPGTDIARGTEVITMGWGRLENLESTQRLQEIAVEVGHPEICENLPARFSRKLELCVVSRFRDQGSCYGDRGGPAIIREEITGEFVQVGISSWGNPGCDTHYGAVFDRVSIHTPWIIRQIRNQATKQETGDLTLSALHYCLGLECVFDATWNVQYTESGERRARFIWRTEDGGTKAGADAKIFRHTFPTTGSYDVLLSIVYENGQRETTKFSVDVKRDGVNRDRIRVKDVTDIYVTPPWTISFDYWGRGQGTWLHDGNVRVTLQGSAHYDMELSLWKFDFSTDEWSRVSQSRSFRSVERIRQNVRRGFYYLSVRFYGIENPSRQTARLTTEFWRSKRDVCLLDSFLTCRGPKI